MVRVMGVGVLLVALALALASLALTATPESALASHEGCYWLNLQLISEETKVATTNALEARGWYSDPTDSIDALYSPGCGAVGEFGGEA